ncbi:TPA: hypothetical protein DCE37_01065 [Candidatus Latescibacteria bacterium]|nr:hypothetical protein [Candidatus Latescibacterota bacterium]
MRSKGGNHQDTNLLHRSYGDQEGTKETRGGVVAGGHNVTALFSADRELVTFGRLWMLVGSTAMNRQPPSRCVLRRV